jgi:16S rRNA A1518/A1519 N6-dimethyltransferase RsmA/KsgA/DIM1 with predicted DNA glycosylase/AP lyase activity
MVAAVFGLLKNPKFMILIKTFLKDILKKLNINAYSDFLMFKLRTKNEINKESNIYKFYNKLLKRDHLIFDIGANIGNHAAVFSKLGKKVICVEPQNYCYKFLKLRFSGNKNVVVILTFYLLKIRLKPIVLFFSRIIRRIPIL